MPQKQTNPEPMDAASGLGKVNSRPANDLRENSIPLNSLQDRLVAVTPYLSCNEEVAAVFRTEFLAKTRNVFEKHGPDGFIGSKHAAAVHEAGHAIVFCALGQRPTRLKLQRKFYEIDGVSRMFWGGVTETERKSFLMDMRSNPYESLTEIAFVAAGFLAEMHFDHLLPGSSLDERVYAAVLCSLAEIAFDLPEGAAAHLVGQIVKQTFDDFAAEHAKLTRRLLHHNVVRAAELDRLLEPLTRRRLEFEWRFRWQIDLYLRDRS